MNISNLCETFDENFPFAILYIGWNGLNIERFKTMDELDEKFEEYSLIYKFIKKVILTEIKENEMIKK